MERELRLRKEADMRWWQKKQEDRRVLMKKRLAEMLERERAALERERAEMIVEDELSRICRISDAEAAQAALLNAFGNVMQMKRQSMWEAEAELKRSQSASLKEKSNLKKRKAYMVMAAVFGAVVYSS